MFVTWPQSLQASARQATRISAASAAAQPRRATAAASWDSPSAGLPARSRATTSRRRGLLGSGWR